MAPKKKTPTTSANAAEAAAAAAAQAAALIAEAERLRQEAERLAAEEEAKAAAMTEGKSKGALKNLRRRQKKNADKEAERIAEENYNLMKEQMQEEYRFSEDEIVEERNAVVARLQGILNSLEIPTAPETIRSDADKLRNGLRKLIAECDEEAEENLGDAVPAPEGIDCVKIYIQLQELTEEGETDAEDLAWIESDLIKSLKWELFCEYRDAVRGIATEAENRIERIQGALDAARDALKAQSAQKRLADLKGVEVSEITEEIVSEIVVLPELVANALVQGIQAGQERGGFFGPLNTTETINKAFRDFHRRLERETGVYIEKQAKYSKDTLTLTGQASDVEAALVVVRKIDLSGTAVYPNTFEKPVGAIIGKSGANLKAIEREFGVIAIPTSTDLTSYKSDHIEVHGSPAAVAKAFEYLDDLFRSSAAEKDRLNKERDAAEKERAARPTISIQEFEIPALKAAAVRINVQRDAELVSGSRSVRVKNVAADSKRNYLEPVPAADAKATLSIRGFEEEVQKAKKHIDAFLGKIAQETVSLSAAQLSRLTPEGVEKFQRIADVPNKVLREVVMLRVTQAGYIFVDKEKSELVVLAEKSELPSFVSLLKVVLEKGDLVTERVNLKRENIKAIPNLEIVKLERKFPTASIIVAVSHPAAANAKPPGIIVKASSDAIEEVVQAVKDLAEAYGATATIENPSSALLGNLLARSAANLRELENSQKVVVSIIRAPTPEGEAPTRGGETIVITGQTEGVAAAEKVIRQTAEVLDSTEVKEITLKEGEAAALIGVRGSTIRRIDALVQRASIAKDNTKLVLKGLPDQLAKAEALVKTLLTELANKQAQKNKDQLAESKTEDSVELKQSTPASPAKRSAEETFPSLGESKAETGFWGKKEETAAPVAAEEQQE